MEVRALTPADSAAFLNLLLTLDEETKFMMYEPGERDTSLPGMEQRLKNADGTLAVILGAFDQTTGPEALVGFIGLSRSGARRARHSAYIVIGILASHSGRGLGRLLFDRAKAWAKGCGVTRLELTVMVHNLRAVKLYESVGFVQEGVKRNSMLVDGTYVDEYYMGKIISESC